MRVLHLLLCVALSTAAVASAASRITAASAQSKAANVDQAGWMSGWSHLRRCRPARRRGNRCASIESAVAPPGRSCTRRI